MTGKNFVVTIFLSILLFNVKINNVFAVDEGTVDSSSSFSFKAAKKKTAGDECNKFVRKKKWKIGNNVKSNGQRFYIQVGSAPMNQVWGKPGFIDSRQNAYEIAMLNAKQKIAENLGTEIQRSLVYNIASGKFANPQVKKELALDAKKNGKSYTDNRDMSSALKKGMELLNRRLDDELKKTDPPKPATTKKEALKKAEALVKKSKDFSDAIQTVAQTNLYGLIRIFVSESGGKGEQSTRCVVALYSDNTKKIADAVKLKDPSMFPKGKKGKSIYDIVGDPETENGLKSLFSSFGVITKKDDKGDWNVIAFGQSEIDGDDATALEFALGEARTMAQGAIRTYIGENVAASKILEKSEKYKQLVNNKKEVTNTKSFQQSVKSESKKLKLVGMEDVLDWSLEATPGSNIGVAGVVIRLSFTSLGEAISNKEGMNNRPTGDGSSGKKSSSDGSKKSDGDYSKSSGGFKSSSGGDTKEDDF